MKRIILLVLASIMALALSACTTSSNPTASNTASPATSTPPAQPSASAPSQTEHEQDGQGDIIDDYQYSLRLDFSIEGLVLQSDNEYILDDEVNVYADILGAGSDARALIEDYITQQNSEISEWLALEENAPLAQQTSYPVWIAEYYIGYEEDTKLCVDAVVLTDDCALILHTVRDADLDMNTDIDFNARIGELFMTIEVVTV